MTNNKKYEEMLKKARITSIDDLLCVPKGNSLDIPLDQLRAFNNHPFRVVDDDKIEAESEEDLEELRKLEKLEKNEAKNTDDI